MKTHNRLRKIHLDFHNSPLIGDLGSAFDADAFADTLTRARVNYVVCFAKCHHGMCYYPAKTGPVHPALTFDLLGAQIEACHKRDIAVSAYLSVVWEEEAARLHPEWRQLGPDGTPRHKIPGDRWATVCLNSPYVREMLIPQTEEVCRRYDVDGMWFDMIHLDDNACHCEWCRRRMRDRGLSYNSPDDCYTHTADTVYEFLALCSGAIRAIRPGVDLHYNSQVRIPARRALPHVTGFEIECTPSERGYLYFDLFSRHVRTYGLPTHGVSPRFHRIWADFGSLKNEAQMRWETATMLAAGSGCSIGDQMHPRGRLDAAVYERIGAAYAHVEACEPWCFGAVPVAEVAVVAPDDKTDFGIAKTSDPVWGAVRMLAESQVQFDVVDRRADFSKYRLLVLPGEAGLEAGDLTRAQAFLDAGGALIAAADAGRIPGLGVTPAGLTPFTANYIYPLSPFKGNLPDMPMVVRQPFVQVTPEPGTEILAETWSPYFERTPEHFTSHHQSPPDKPSPYPAVTRRGRAIFVAAPVFDEYHRQGDTHCRLLVDRCLALLLPDPLVRAGMRPLLAVSLTRQPGRLIAHLVAYAANKRGAAPETIEAIPPLADTALQIRAEKPTRVYLAPSGNVLPFEYRDGYVCVTVPEIDIHAVVVMDMTGGASTAPTPGVVQDCQVV